MCEHCGRGPTCIVCGRGLTLTLKKWVELTGVKPTGPTTERGAVSVAIGEHEEMRRRLFDLSDYKVMTVDGPIVWLAPRPPRYNVDAAVVALDSKASDGAYSLIMRDVTAGEIAQRIHEELYHSWGLVSGGGYGSRNEVPAKLEIVITRVQDEQV